MKNTFAKKFTVCTLAGVLGFAFSACDDSSSAGGDDGETSVLSSSAKDTEPAEVTDKSSDAKSSSSAKETKNSSDSRSSSSVKSGDSSSSSSAGKAKSSSSVVTLANPCKTETEDNCEYGELTDDRDGQTYNGGWRRTSTTKRITVSATMILPNIAKNTVAFTHGLLPWTVRALGARTARAAAITRHARRPTRCVAFAPMVGICLRKRKGTP